MTIPTVAIAEDNPSVEGPCDVAEIPFYLDAAKDPVETLDMVPLASNPALRPGEYVRYIDRIDVPDYARFLYDWAVEASDNDGVDDWLIDDRYLQPDGATDLRGVRNRGAIVKIWGGYGLSLGVVDAASADDLRPIMNATSVAFYLDHPEVFWLDKTFPFGVVRDGDANCLVVELSGDNYSFLSPLYSKEAEVVRDIGRRDAQVSAILAESVEMGANAYTRVRAFDRWLALHNEYYEGNLPAMYYTDGNTTCFNALMGSSGEAGPVCGGYAHAFKVLCDAAGIPCVLCTGSGLGVGGAYGHVWNLVQLQGHWFAVDVTWDDLGDDRAYFAYNLVGSETVVGGRAFSQSHELMNCFPADGFRFMNQPTMSPTAYDPKTAPAQVDIARAEIQVPRVTYTGDPLEPAPMVTYDGKILVPGVDYFVSCANNVNAGSGSLTVTGMEGFTGRRTVPFPITKARPSLAIKSPLAIDPDDGARTVEVGGSGGRAVSASSSDQKVVKVSATGGSLTLTPSSRGEATVTVRVAGDANHEAASAAVPVHVEDVVTVYRLYNAATGEHLWTTDANEYRTLGAGAAWTGEGESWRSPESGAPVWRLYQPSSGKHLYTADATERRALLASGQGWRDEGVCWRSDTADRMAVYRLYNPGLPFATAHHFTTDANVYAYLARVGWRQEGVCWSAVGM